MQALKHLFIVSILIVIPLYTKGQCHPGDTTAVGGQSLQNAIETPIPIDTTLFGKIASGEQRILYWVHGLSGDRKAWNPVAGVTKNQAVTKIPDYPDRKVVSHAMTYAQTSMNDAIGDLYTFTNQMNFDSSSYAVVTDNFIISHSQGGIVSRGLDKEMDIDPYWDREYGGIVTFGSAHQGAHILNVALNTSGINLIEQMTIDACNNLAAGPIEEALDLNSTFVNALIRNFDVDDSLRAFSQTACSFFGKDVLPFALSDFTAGITQDYKIGAPYLDSLNAYTNQWPKVAFYGVEQEPVFWRTMNSMIADVTSFPAFEANDDSTFLDHKALIANYLNKRNTYQAQLDGLLRIRHKCGERPLFSFFNPGLCTGILPEIELAVDKINAYDKGYQWLNNANQQWKAIIGARTTQTTQGGYICECDNIDKGTHSRSIVPSIDDCPQGATSTSQGKVICQAYPHITTTVIQKENDGVVLKESAANLPGATTFGDDRLELKYTNHFQLRNSEETRAKLFGLFEGDYGRYFKTLNR